MTTTSLDLAPRMTLGSVVRFGAAIKSRARLLSFGLVPGSFVRVLQNHGKSALLVEVDGMRFALDRLEAREIHIAGVA